MTPLTKYPPCIPGIAALRTRVPILRILKFEGPDEVRSAGLSGLRAWPFSGKRDKAKALRMHAPRLAQLARAPDCRLETHGCRQPSGGPRFKSGSADHNLVERIDYETVPPTVVCKLTDSGTSLLPSLEAFFEWVLNDTNETE